jgi:hypothetical protein
MVPGGSIPPDVSGTSIVGIMLFLADRKSIPLLNNEGIKNFTPMEVIMRIAY